jgi:hypothetical protein
MESEVANPWGREENALFSENGEEQMQSQHGRCCAMCAAIVD